MSVEISALSRSGRLIIAIATTLSFIFAFFVDFIPSPFGGYADQRFALLTVSGFLIIASTFFLALRPPENLKSSLLQLCPTFLFSFAFIFFSLPFRSHSYVWVEPGMYGCFFFSAVLAGAWLSWAGESITAARFLAFVTAIFCTAYGLASINVYLFAVNDGVKNLVEYLPWGFVNIRYWSHIATWCLPLLPLAALVGPLKKYRLWRFFTLIGAGIWWWILFLSAGRGSFLAIVFGLLVVTMLFGRHAYPWLKILFTYILAGVFLWLLLSVILPSFLGGRVEVASIRTDSSGRMPLFLEAWQMSMQSFPFGMGPQSWLTHDVLTEGYSVSAKFGHPHNMYLMWAAEYGWVLIAFLGLVAAQAVKLFFRARAKIATSKDREELTILAAITGSVSSALFHAGGSAVFMAPASMLVGLVVLIAFWSLIIPGKSAGIQLSSSSIGNSKISATGLTLAIGLFVIWLLWMKATWSYYEAMRLDEQQYFETVGEGILPRFWFHGNFPRQSEQ